MSALPMRSMVRSTKRQFQTPNSDWLCSVCRSAGRSQAILYPLSSIRARNFSTSISYAKKSGNAKSAKRSPAITSPGQTEHIPDNKHSRNVDSEPDPYDHSELQSAIDAAIARLKDALTKTRDAGRVSVEMLEGLAVDLNIKGANAHGGSAHKEKVKVGDISSVVPKGGRTMQIFAAQEDHVKPLIASVQASPYSLAPQPDPANPLLILVPVPPATAETRKQAAEEARKCYDKAALEVRNARGDIQKKFRKMEQQKTVVPDELRKAHKSMEDVAKKGQDEVKKVFDAAVKALQN